MSTPVGGVRISTPTDKLYALKFTSISSYLIYFHRPVFGWYSSIYTNIWSQGSGPLLIQRMIAYSAFQLYASSYSAPCMADCTADLDIWLQDPFGQSQIVFVLISFK